MEKQLDLFGNNDCQKTYSLSKRSDPIDIGIARKYAPINRYQTNLLYSSLDCQLPANHQARVVWKFVENLDLTEFIEPISTIEWGSGRPAIHPKILIALWIYGISEGIVSSRKIAKYSKEHWGFAWICGNVSVGHHALSGFRAKYAHLFQELVVQSISLLVHNDLLELKQISQDGVKIQANASKASFHRKKTLKEMKAEVSKHIRTLEHQQKNGEMERAEREQKSRELIQAQEKEKRFKKALSELEKHKNEKNENRIKHNKNKLSNQEISQMRVSTTDPECRNMRMADGSYKSAYNIQIATEVNSELAVGLKVTQAGTDGGQMLPMYQYLKCTYEQAVDHYLADLGYKNAQDLEAMFEEGVSVYMPTKGTALSLKKRVLSDNNKKVPLAQRDWIERMETDEGNKLYSRRIRSSETINAYFRNHGLGRILVKGLGNINGMLGLFCLAYNLTVLQRLDLLG
jgi:transposase